MPDPERYQSALTGPEMDQALLDMANHTSERFAKGTANGVAVAAGTDGYQDNSKYYKDQAANQVQLAANQVSQATAQADRAANAADRAEAAVPAGIDSAVLFTRAQTLTATQQAQARKNIAAGGSNKNLLDNPFFTVNQRGITSASGTGAFANNAYRMDRWYTTYSASPNTGSWNFTNGVLTIDNSGTTNRGLFCQRIENHAWLAGKKITLSVLFADGTMKSGTITRNDNVGQTFGISGISTEFSRENNILIGPTSGGTIAIKAVKLELGTVSTLANDAPPDYAEELAKCQYYFRRFSVSSGGSVFFGYMSADNVATFPNIFNIPMRAKPSVTKTGAVYVRTTNNTNLGVTAVSTNYEPPAVSLNATISGSVTTYQIARLIFASGAYLDFSADL